MIAKWLLTSLFGRKSDTRIKGTGMAIDIPSDKIREDSYLLDSGSHKL